MVVVLANVVVVGTMLDISLCCEGHARTQGQRSPRCDHIQSLIVLHSLDCGAWQDGLLGQVLVSPPLNTLQEITSTMGIDTGWKN